MQKKSTNKLSKNFKRVRQNIDIDIFKQELNSFLQEGNRWSFLRSRNLPVQRETKHIDLRKAFIGSEKLHYSNKEQLYEFANTEYHELDIKNYPYFIKTYDYLEKFADSIDGQLCRVAIVSLNPYGKVYPHVDTGVYYVGKDRYHLPVITKGSINICDGEEQIYYEGELWWFDNKKNHEAHNPSQEERVHIIFDILPKKRNALRKLRDFLDKKRSLFAYEIQK